MLGSPCLPFALCLPSWAFTTCSVLLISLTHGFRIIGLYRPYHRTPIRLAELSLDQYGVSVSPNPVMRKPRLNLKLSMTGRISVQPETSLTSKMSAGFELEGGLEVGFLWWPTFLLNRLQCRDLGHGRRLIMLLPPEMEPARERRIQSALIYQCWRRRNCECLFPTCSDQRHQHFDHWTNARICQGDNQSSAAPDYIPFLFSSNYTSKFQSPHFIRSPKK